jgi:hypothetical protein
MSTVPFQSSNDPGPAAHNPQRLALDNMIRRELKVANPSDPQQIAAALLDRYKADPRALAIAQEARGLPFLHTGATATPPIVLPTSSSAEWQQAVEDVEADLRALSSDAILKDVRPEIQGWAQALRSALREGYNAGRFALDPRNRDKCFGIRRQLNDYARVARLMGTLTSSITQYYRKLAQSLDEAAAVLLVVMGEALSNIGIGGGRYLLQAPYTELQVRRDAAIYALRNLVGATQQAYGPNDWPRGLDSYRALYTQLETQGQGDLRALLEEGELARLMDELIQRAANGDVQGLRALGSTAQIDLNRVRRLVSVAHQIANPESPPLAAFLESLMLFSEAFDTAGGIRLLRIARPPILLYGLYGQQSLLSADQRLLQLIQRRGVFANQIDCYTTCACSDDAELTQMVFDKVLYDVDRAIDLYALGNDELGPPEGRASAYSFVIDSALLHTARIAASASSVVDPQVTFAGSLPCSLPRDGDTASETSLAAIRQSLVDIRGLLRPIQGDASRRYWDIAPADYARAVRRDHRHQELCFQRDSELRLRSLVETMAPGCIADAAIFGAEDGVIQRLMRRALNLNRFDLVIDLGAKSGDPAQVRSTNPDVPVEEVLTHFNDNSGRPALDICALIDLDHSCAPVNIKIPPHYETSLDSIANDVTNSGGFRFP